MHINMVVRACDRATRPAVTAEGKPVRDTYPSVLLTYTNYAYRITSCRGMFEFYIDR